jgi:hypothetical protein
VRFDDRDRRRLLVASALTVAALPAVWLANQGDEGSPRPNVAAVGAAVDDASRPTTHTSVDPMGTVGPQFLDGTAAPADRPQAVAPVVGGADGHVVATATAIFRRNVTDDHRCLFNGVPVGSRVTVVNVDNARSIQCTTVLRPMDQPQDELVMSAAAFAEIADPSAAPIDVEIRQ